MPQHFIDLPVFACSFSAIVNVTIVKGEGSKDDHSYCRIKVITFFLRSYFSSVYLFSLNPVCNPTFTFLSTSLAF